VTYVSFGPQYPPAAGDYCPHCGNYKGFREQALPGLPAAFRRPAYAWTIDTATGTKFDPELDVTIFDLVARPADALRPDEV
jgi:hypothetical protein